MKDNRKNRKKSMLHKCDYCGLTFRAFRCPHVNIFFAYRDCPKCGLTPLPF